MAGLAEHAGQTVRPQSYGAVSTAGHLSAPRALSWTIDCPPRLATDYEVFLLGRIREAWDRTSDNATAVANGMQHTGRIITAAALLLITVCAGFATGQIVLSKIIGIGMIIAIAIDAFLVRTLLVPATMRLLGRFNWWTPRMFTRRRHVRWDTPQGAR